MAKLTKSVAAALLGLSILVAAGVLIALPGGSQPQADQQWDDTAARILDRTFEGPLPAPTPTGSEPRRTGVYAGFLIAALLSVLYAYRRRRYILQWVAAWLLLSFGFYLISRGYAAVEHARLAVIALELSKIGVAVLLLRSAHDLSRAEPRDFAQPPRRGGTIWLLIPALLAWFALSGRLSVATVLAPAYVITGVIHLRTATLFASSFRRRRMWGALLLAVCLGIVGITNAGYGLFFTRVIMSSRLLLLFLTSNSLAFLMAAFGMHLLVFEEVTRELRDAHDDVRRLAIVDAVTGSHNRRFFEENIDRELQRHRRYGTPLSLLFVDIDRFKHVNDSLGHDAGDRVLQSVGDLLRRKVRGADYVIRWGGDEFLVLMTCSGAAAMEKVKALKESFDELRDSGGVPAWLSISIGCAEVPPDATDVAPAIRQADQSMYADKNKIGVHA